jgi:Leucine-rich repeat (LRR) protein
MTSLHIPTDHLNLVGFCFTGTIPSEIGYLTTLSYLNLQGGSLSGEIPSELGVLTNLEYLLLENNFLEGTIPSELDNLADGLCKISFLCLLWHTVLFKNLSANTPFDPSVSPQCSSDSVATISKGACP